MTSKRARGNCFYNFMTPQKKVKSFFLIYFQRVILFELRLTFRSCNLYLLKSETIMAAGTIEKLKHEYEEDVEGFLAEFSSMFGNEIKDCQFVVDNEIFTSFNSKLPQIRTEYPDLSIEGSPIFTLVETPVGWRLKYHNCLTLYFLNGCHLRFSPHEDGLEITRLYIPPQNQGQGFGSKLMNIFLDILEKTLPKLPPILVELTGSVGTGPNQLDLPISQQEKFFAGFGFTACRGEDDENYIKMVL